MPLCITVLKMETLSLWVIHKACVLNEACCSYLQWCICAPPVLGECTKQVSCAMLITSLEEVLRKAEMSWDLGISWKGNASFTRKGHPLTAESGVLILIGGESEPSECRVFVTLFEVGLRGFDLNERRLSRVRVRLGVLPWRAAQFNPLLNVCCDWGWSASWVAEMLSPEGTISSRT